MNTLMIDNFLSKDECSFLIDFYKTNEKKSHTFRDVYPLTLKLNDPSISFLIEKQNKISKLFNSKINWFEIVKWPVNSEHVLHFDERTTCTSIVYLNDNFEGGQTYYEDNTIFQPARGRGLFFNGNYYKHGVKKVSKNTRYVVASWYKLWQ